jgi:Protein of unknown function (DUF2585)
LIRGWTKLRTLVAGAAVVATAASIELAMGRRIWGISGQPGIWSGDINSEHNSQYFADPYSFSHITHGILLYGLLSLTGRNLPVRIRALIVLAMEAGWEVLENSNMVINRYRAETISLHYYGDSVVNSMSDIMFCMMGFTLAYLLPTRMAIILVIALEVLLALWIRDGFFLNVIMLIHPFSALRTWQAGM